MPPSGPSGAGSKGKRREARRATAAARPAPSRAPRGAGATTSSGLGRAAVQLGRARGRRRRRCRLPTARRESALGRPARGPAPLRHAAVRARARSRTLAKAAGCTLNDVVLYLCGTALRRYLTEHGQLPDRPLTAGIPVNLREADDESTGTAIGMMVAELGTNVADPLQRLRGDQALDGRGEAAPERAARRGADVLHAAAQRPVHRRA